MTCPGDQASFRPLAAADLLGDVGGLPQYQLRSPRRPRVGIPPNVAVLACLLPQVWRGLYLALGRARVADALIMASIPELGALAVSELPKRLQRLGLIWK